MRTSGPQCTKERASGARSPMNFLKRREEGTTAIEFALVAVPFFMFIFGLMGVSTYFFIMTSLEKGMDQASRSIRTGQAQSVDMKVKDFKRKLCRKANSKADLVEGQENNTAVGDDNGWIKCQDMQVFVQTFASWAAVQPKNCLQNNPAVVNTSNGNDKIASYSGEANAIVLVTTCYRWKFAGKIPFINLGQMGDGSMMMQSATAFRTEPYATN